jgi:Fe-S-cluster-containing dehydrogenase component
MGLKNNSNKKLIINLDNFRSDKINPECSYPFNSNDTGITNLIEVATYSLICRHCEEGACVKSCPTQALFRSENGIIKRYNMRCISCKSCSVACPFGTIIPEMLSYRVSICDYCLERVKDKPLCVKSAKSKNILDYVEVSEINKDFINVGDNLLVYATKWQGGTEKKL